ncbi:MAG: hypothetical protein ACREF9_07310 [Opitutaceae bacterium]
MTVAMAHFTPIPAGWEENLARLSDVHRRFAIAQNIFIGGVMIFAGMVSVLFAPELVSGATGARIVCAGIALWWGARLSVLPWLHVGPELRTPLLRGGFVLLHVECAAFAILYGWLALRPA